jgi:hypothetical protein
MWLWANTSTTTMQVGLGTSGDFGTVATGALTTTPKLFTMTWTPTADRDVAYIYVSTTTATATTFRLDGAAVYEGTTAPSGRHIEGRGAAPPIGVFDAEGSDTVPTLTADANARSGNVVRMNVATLVGGGQQFYFPVDPSLILPDEFTSDLALTVWARMSVPTTAVNPSVTLSYAPSAGQTTVLAFYSNEYGGAGRTLPVPASAPAPMLYRLGTLIVPNEQLRYAPFGRVGVFCNAAGGTGNWDFDYIFVTPAFASARSVSGKAASTINPYSYGTNEVKRVRYDLVGRSSDGGMMSGETPSASMGGPQITPPPGNARFVALLSGAAGPDDPAPTTGNHDGTAANKVATVHFSVVPRYRLTRGS